MTADGTEAPFDELEELWRTAAKQVHVGEALSCWQLEGSDPRIGVAFTLAEADRDRPGRERFWIENCVWSAGYSVMCVRPAQRLWYPAQQMAPALPTIRAAIAQAPSVFTYGSSMGAYGALKWAAAIGAKVAIAISPQYSIDPAVIGRSRYTVSFRPEINGGMAVRREDLAPLNIVFYDPYHAEDRMHAEALRQLGGGGTVVELVEVPWTGHGTTALVAESRFSKDILTLCLAQDLDGLRRLVRVGRRVVPQRFHMLSLAALPRRTKAALAFHARLPADCRPLLVRQFSGALDEAGMPEAALDLVMRHGLERPKDQEIQLHLFRQLRRHGRDAAIAAWESRLAPADVRLPALAVSLCDAARRSERPERMRLWAETAAARVADWPDADASRVLMQVADTLSLGRLTEAALERIGQSLAREPRNQDAIAAKLRILSRLSRWDEATRIERAQDPQAVTEPQLAVALAEVAHRPPVDEVRAQCWSICAERLLQDSGNNASRKANLMQRLDRLRARKG